MRSIRKPLLLIALLGITLLIMNPRAPRYEDENIALITGKAFFDALTSSDPQVKLANAMKDANNGIGWTVCIPAYLIYALSHSILISRIVLIAYTLLFWVGLCLVFFKLAEKLQIKIREGQKTYFTFILIGFLQGIPSIYFYQLMVLSEFPGLTYLTFSIYFLLNKNLRASALCLGLMSITKVTFLLFVPFLFLMVIRTSWKNLSGYLFFSILPFLALQACKFLAFGPDAYLAAWKHFSQWVFTSSGAGLSSYEKTNIQGFNEWLGYTRREKFYILVGGVGPLIASFSLLFSKIPQRKKIFFIYFIFSAFVFAGFYQWFFMANLKWWRRTFYFMVPGYLSLLYLFLYSYFCSEKIFHLQKKYKSLRATQYALLTSLCLYVFLRHGLYGSYTNSRPLTPNQAHEIDWNNAVERFLEPDQLGK